MKRWLRWPIRIALGLLGILAAAIAALLLWKPRETWLLLAILIHPLIANTRPPAIAADQFVDANFQNQGETNRKLNALFQQRFPGGTSEATLKAALLDQGFKRLPPPVVECLPEGKEPAVGVAYTRCPTFDLNKALEYRWGIVACGASITVIWSTDDSQRVRDLKVSYYEACL
jgi:hypothetical protein